MKRLLFLCLICISVNALKAQIITVVDTETNSPLESAMIIGDEDDRVLITDSRGQVDISSLVNSETIQIRMVGYSTQEISLYQLENQGYVLYMDPTSLELEQYVVSATRWNQSTADVPQKIITITPGEAAFINPQTAADLLSVSGQVYVQKSQQGGGSPMIRGFATNRLLYTVDGVRMNTAIFRSGNIQNVISLDPFAVESTEVSFGPGSVIYGSDAIGGVMSFQTLSPTFSLDDQVQVGGKAIMRYSTANQEQTVHGDVKLGWKKWALATSFSGNIYGDLRQGSNGLDDYLKSYLVERINGEDRVLENSDPRIQSPSGYTQYNLTQKLRFKPNEQWDFQFGFHYSETSSYGRYDRHLRTRKGEPRYGEWSYGPQVWMMNNLNVFHNSESKFFDGFTLRLAQQRFEESRRDRDFRSTDRRVRTEKVDAYSVNLDFNKSINKKNKVFYGLEWVLNDVNSTGIEQNIRTGDIQDVASRYPMSSWASYAIYLTHDHKLNEKVNLQTGFRYNRFALDATFDTRFYPLPFNKAELNEGALTGTFGVVYRPKDDWVVTSNFATGFRAPNVDDVGKVFDSEPGAVVVPNPNLEAETAYSADLGLARVFSNFLKLELTAFYTYLDNAMVRRDFQLDGNDEIVYDGELSTVQAIQNAASAEVFGFQVSAEVKLPGGFGFSTMYNYQNGEEELDNGATSAMRHAAPPFGRSRVDYKKNKWQMSLMVDYHSEVLFADLPVSEQGKIELYALDINGNPFSPAWYSLDLKSQYSFQNGFIVTAGLENITDQRYRPYSSGISAPGRNLVISARINF